MDAPSGSHLARSVYDAKMSKRLKGPRTGSGFCVAKSGCEKTVFGGGGTQNKLLVLVQSDKHQLDGRNRDYTVACVCICLVVLVIWCSGTVAVCKKGRSGGGVGG